MYTYFCKYIQYTNYTPSYDEQLYVCLQGGGGLGRRVWGKTTSNTSNYQGCYLYNPRDIPSV